MVFYLKRKIKKEENKMLKPLDNVVIVVRDKRTTYTNKILEKLALVRSVLLTGMAVIGFVQAYESFIKGKKEESKGE